MLKSGSAETTPLRARSNRCAYTDPPAALWRLLSTAEYISVTSCLIVFGSFLRAATISAVRSLDARLKN